RVALGERSRGDQHLDELVEAGAQVGEGTLGRARALLGAPERLGHLAVEGVDVQHASTITRRGRAYGQAANRATLDGVRLAWLAVALSASACGGSDSGDCAPGLISQSNECLTPPNQPVRDLGGAVLGAMEVWTIVFTGDEAIGSAVDTLNGLVLAS